VQRLALLALLIGSLTTASYAADKSPAGRIESFTFTSNAFHNTRSIHIWLPPAYDDPASASARYPVLYMNDGQAVFHNMKVPGRDRDWGADEAASKLISSGKIEPLIIVAIDNAGDDRDSEYMPVKDKYYRTDLKAVQGDLYPEMLFDEVIPFVNQHYRTRADDIGLGGSSMGAAIALYTVAARPGQISRLLLESPSLYVGEGWLLDKAKANHQWPSRIYLGIGTNEMPNDAHGSREAVGDVDIFHKLLNAAGVPKSNVMVRVQPDATHNTEAWADRFPAALKFLYGK
jgi:predicted alpha/beta superfamily hydrolase